MGKLSLGVDLKTGEVKGVDVETEMFIRKYFATSEEIRILKSRLKGLRGELDVIYEQYCEHRAEKGQGKLFE